MLSSGGIYHCGDDSLGLSVGHLWETRHRQHFAAATLSSFQHGCTKWQACCAPLTVIRHWIVNFGTDPAPFQSGL